MFFSPLYILFLLHIGSQPMALITVQYYSMTHHCCLPFSFIYSSFNLPLILLLWNRLIIKLCVVISQKSASVCFGRPFLPVSCVLVALPSVWLRDLRDPQMRVVVKIIAWKEHENITPDSFNFIWWEGHARAEEEKQKAGRFAAFVDVTVLLLAGRLLVNYCALLKPANDCSWL